MCAGSQRHTAVAVTGSRPGSPPTSTSTRSSRGSPPRSSPPMQSGLVVVDKPAGWTSHDVVGRVRKLYGQRRVGHAGTLDPDATGVLLVGLGRVTRLLRFLQETDKEYRGEVVFGVATSTLDGAGEVLDRRPLPVTREQVVRAAQQ